VFFSDFVFEPLLYFIFEHLGICRYELTQLWLIEHLGQHPDASQTTENESWAGHDVRLLTYHEPHVWPGEEYEQDSHPPPPPTVIIVIRFKRDVTVRRSYVVFPQGMGTPTSCRHPSQFPHKLVCEIVFVKTRSSENVFRNKSFFDGKTIKLNFLTMSMCRPLYNGYTS
jgi:hypothetical protein